MLMEMWSTADGRKNAFGFNTCLDPNTIKAQPL